MIIKNDECKLCYSYHEAALASSRDHEEAMLRVITYSFTDPAPLGASFPVEVQDICIRIKAIEAAAYQRGKDEREAEIKDLQKQIEESRKK